MKEMVGGCCVCSDERGWPDNPLVYCDGNGCTVAVHQACYGIVTVPTGPWYCRKCESPETGKGKVRCELCPSRSGALKKADTGGWAHVVCALYIPEVRFGNVTSMEPIVLRLIPPERFTRTCYICTENGKAHRAGQGACMACNKSGCKQQFHVTCAQSLGLLCEEAGNYLDNVKYCGYCQHHYSKLFTNQEVTVIAKKKGGNVKTIPPYKPVAHDSHSSGSSSEKEGGASPAAAPGADGTLAPPTRGSKGPGKKSSQNKDAAKSSHTTKAGPSTPQPMDKKKSPSRRQSSTGDGGGSSKSSTPAPSPSHSTDGQIKAAGGSSERGRERESTLGCTPPASSPPAGKSPPAGALAGVISATPEPMPATVSTITSVVQAPARFQESVITNTDAVETKHTKKRKAAAAAAASASATASASASASVSAQSTANESPIRVATVEMELRHNKRRKAAATAAAAAAAAADIDKPASESPKRAVTPVAEISDAKMTKKRRAAAAAVKEPQPPLVSNENEPHKDRPSSMHQSPNHPTNKFQQKHPKKRKAAAAANVSKGTPAAADEKIPEKKSPATVSANEETKHTKKRKAVAVASAAAEAAAEAREKAAQIIADSEAQAGHSTLWEHGHQANEAPVPMDTTEKAVKKAKTDDVHYMSPPPPPPLVPSPRHMASPVAGPSSMNPPALMIAPSTRSPSQHQATMESGMPSHPHAHAQRPNRVGLHVTYKLHDHNKPGVSGAAGSSKEHSGPLGPPLAMPSPQPMAMPPAIRNKKRAAMAAASMAIQPPPPPPPPPPPLPSSSTHLGMASTSSQALGSRRLLPPSQPLYQETVRDSPPVSPNLGMASTSSQALGSRRLLPPSQPLYQETVRDSPPVSPNSERQKPRADQFYSRLLAPHMLGNELNPDSGAAGRLQEQLSAELAAHAVGAAASDHIVPPPLINKAVGSASGRSSGAQSLDQLLERQWEQGSQFLMEQAQHFDIASLLSCLHQLRTDNVRLEEHVVNLLQRRDHLLAVNARLAIPLNAGGVADSSYHLTFQATAPPAEVGRGAREAPPPPPPPPPPLRPPHPPARQADASATTPSVPASATTAPDADRDRLDRQQAAQQMPMQQKPS